MACHEERNTVHHHLCSETGKEDVVHMNKICRNLPEHSTQGQRIRKTDCRKLNQPRAVETPPICKRELGMCQDGNVPTIPGKSLSQYSCVILRPAEDWERK